MPTTTAPQPQSAQRVIVGDPFTASYTYGLDGDPLPDSATSVTVSITNAAGTVVTSGTATLGAVSGGQQTATFAVAASLPARDFLTAAWTATVNALPIVDVSTIDVCDFRLFPTVDYSQFAELATFTSAQLEEKRMHSEDFLERECGMAFTGRYRVQTFSLPEPPDLTAWDWSAWGWPAWDYDYDVAHGVVSLVLDRPFVQAIRNLSQTTVDDNGNPTTQALPIASTRFDSANGILFYRDNLGDGMYGDLTVGYEHGRFEADVRRIALILARYRLLNGPLDARAVQAPAEGGGMVRLLTSGVGGGVTGIPEVDQFCARYSQRGLGFVSGLGL